MSQAGSPGRRVAMTGSEYERVAGHFAACTFVVGAKIEDNAVSTLGSAIAAVSVEPPMLLVCLDRRSATSRAAERSGHFTVDVLTEAQRCLAEQVVDQGARKSGDVASPDSPPLVDESLVHLECSLIEQSTSATHSILIGVVQRGSASDESPLVSYRGRYGGFVSA